MDADQTLLRLIDEEIARLQSARTEITNRLGLPKTNGSVNGHAAAVQGQRPKTGSPLKAEGTSRRDQIITFLKSNGPATTGEILTGTGMPRGSLGFTLSRNEEFERSSDGRWSLKRH